MDHGSANEGAAGHRPESEHQSCDNRYWIPGDPIHNFLRPLGIYEVVGSHTEEFRRAGSDFVTVSAAAGAPLFG
jgi:hypothetical protein